MKRITRFTFLLLSGCLFVACNNNQGKGNDTTDAGTEQYDDVNAPSENRTPSPSMTADSTGAKKPIESDTATTGPEPRK